MSDEKKDDPNGPPDSTITLPHKVVRVPDASARPRILGIAWVEVDEHDRTNFPFRIHTSMSRMIPLRAALGLERALGLQIARIAHEDGPEEVDAKMPAAVAVIPGNPKKRQDN